MAIQTRSGKYEDFEPSKLLPGEWACVRNGDPKAEDGRAIYMAFEPGIVKRMATHEDIVDQVEQAFGDAAEELAKDFTGNLTEITENAVAAAEDANTATDNANKAAENADAATRDANAAAERAEEAAKKAEDIIASPASSGHTIVNSDGNEFPQRSKLKFKGLLEVTDSEEEDATNVTLPEINNSGTSNVIYNPDTDNIDVYTEDGVRSIATGFTEPVGLVPVLSADDGKVICNGYNAQYYPYKVFNGTSEGSLDAWETNATDNVFIGYNFNAKKTVTKIFIKNRNDLSYYGVHSIRSFRLQGSNDLTNWRDIQTFKVSSTASAAEEYFIVDNPQQFSAFRIFVEVSEENNGLVLLSNLQLYGYNEIGVALPEATKSVTLDDSDVFSTEKTYSAGDYCIYNDILYKFIAEKTAGEWDDAVVEGTTVVRELRGGMDLLWENPSPTSNFAEQTISVGDITSYRWLMFHCFKNNANDTEMFSYAPTYSTINFPIGGVVNGYRYTRNAKVSGSSVVFGNGFFDTTQNDTQCIPYRIYGIK